MKILLADDDPQLTKMYEDILTTNVQEKTRELEKNLQIQKIILSAGCKD